MKPNYCLPILESDRTKVLDTVRGNLDGYRYFEVWLDYVDDPDTAFVKELADLLGERLVVTFRRQNLEPPKMPEPKRRELLEALAGTPVLVDLDVKTQQADLEAAKDLQLIASYHNYQETPDTLQLEAILDTMKTYRPAVYKLSTLCRAEGDAVRLLQILLKLKSEGVRAVISGMGEHGTVTRVFGPLWGSEMAFAPLESQEASAPGQLTKTQLETIYKELSK
ncbi:MAG TPA: type I 3-dehydroquinate dehydratase [Candidatus Saccharimonadales bacterium]|nr:type I 3-dehydroquinate dehydratase [Candidatus Saccharimonadales bacterium]